MTDIRFHHGMYKTLLEKKLKELSLKYMRKEYRDYEKATLQAQNSILTLLLSQYKKDVEKQKTYKNHRGEEVPNLMFNHGTFQKILEDELEENYEKMRTFSYEPWEKPVLRGIDTLLSELLTEFKKDLNNQLGVN